MDKKLTKKDLLEMLKNYVIQDYENLIEDNLINGDKLSAEELKEEEKSILQDIKEELEKE